MNAIKIDRAEICLNSEGFHFQRFKKLFDMNDTEKRMNLILIQ